MKYQYEKIEIELFTFDCEDVITASKGEVSGDETKYPIPDGWVQ